MNFRNFLFFVFYDSEWPHRLVVRTLAFQANNTGSTPVGATRFSEILIRQKRRLNLC